MARQGVESLNEMSEKDQAQFEQMRNADTGAEDEGQEQEPAPRQRQQKAPPKAKPQRTVVDRTGADAPPARQEAAEGDEEGAEGAEGEGEEGAEGGERQTTVPQGALHQERQRRKEAEKKSKQAERRVEQILLLAQQGRLGELLDGGQQPAPAEKPAAKPAAAKLPEAPPDFEKDPGGHILWHVLKQNEKMDAFFEGQAQTREQAQRTAQIDNRVRTVLTASQQLESEFMAETPDYNDASTFLKKQRDKQLRLVGIDDPQERQRIMSQEAFNIAERAMQRGDNPAEVIYQMAQSFGYKPKGAPMPGAGEDEGEEETAEEKLARVRAGTRRAQSLTPGRGGAKAPLSAARLLEMSDADFDRAMGTAAGRALLGD